MKIYFVYPSKSDSVLFLEAGVRNFLMSYYYDMDGSKIESLKKNYPDANIMLDSGAYSAYSLGEEILLDDYLEFLKVHKKSVTHAISLDVIGDPLASMLNYKEITKKGFDVMPVYHFNEDLSILDEYCKLSKYVGIGGATTYKWSQRELFNQMSNILRRVPKGVDIHTLGTTNFQLLWKHCTAITSCDSSVISRAARFNETLSMTALPVRVAGNSKGGRASQEQIDNLQRHMVSCILKIEKDINERVTKINGVIK